MTNRFPLYLLISLLFAGMFSACNEDIQQVVTVNDDVNCEVSSFSVIQLSPLFVIIPFVILTLTDRRL